MKLHTLKIKSNFFDEVRFGYKTFELRKNDRDYKLYDLIHFVKINGEDYSDYWDNLYQIIYILKDVEEYGLDKDYCILGIKRL